MSPLAVAGLIAVLGVALALPSSPLIKLDPEIRYALELGPDGKTQLVDLWLSAEALQEVSRYEPETENDFHLFTRQNPTVSQPILYNNDVILGLTNFDPSKRTVMIVHGWGDSVSGDMNSVVVPAFLAADDVNVIVVDWSKGAGTLNYATAVINASASGRAVAEFINWIVRTTSSTAGHFHLVGHSLGGQQVGIIARHVHGDIPYVTALDPAFPGWVTNNDRFSADDAIYTEVIHTNGGVLGYLSNLGDVDFYPNGGRNMAGCDSIQCSHFRCYFYFAESLISGGFTGSRCASYLTALTGNCFLSGPLQMGGLLPKTGSSGIFYLETNAAPPFSRS